MNSVENFLPILFKVLFGFIVLNTIINFILLAIKRKRIYKLLAIYWPALLIVFIAQSTFQEGFVPITLAYSISGFSLFVISIIGMEVIGRKFPLIKFLVLYSLAYPLTFLMEHLNFGFTGIAMPFGIATAAPLIYTASFLLVRDRKKTTKLQKLLGVIFIAQAVHCINFALFRMDPGAQLWGWFTAYAIYDMLAIILPSIALEEANLSENERLNKLVEERTSELNATLKENESLIKVLLHDISNPLMVMKAYLHLFEPKSNDNINLLENIKKSQNVIENIIHKVKDLYIRKKKKHELTPIKLDECLNDISFIFAHSLEKKKVSLEFNNSLSPTVHILADKTSFTHSVLSNLVSNGIKFSSPNSKIEINAKEHNNSIIVEINDQGPGISADVLRNLLQDQELESTKGTAGEVGSGLGLSIVKSFVDSYGGQIEFETRYAHLYPNNSGTSVRITLDKA